MERLVRSLFVIVMFVVVAAGCGSGSSGGSAGEPVVPTPPPVGTGGDDPGTQPPPAPQPPPIVQGLSVAVHEAPSAEPVVGVKVRVLREGGAVAEPVTGVDGIAHIDRLEAGEYDVLLDGLPPHVSAAGTSSTVRFGLLFPKDLAFEVPLELAAGPLVLFGDSDSTSESPFREQSLEDYLNGDPELGAFFGFELVAKNRAQGFTPVADVDDAWHYGLDQVRDAIAEIPDMRFAVLRFGLNDVHSYLFTPNDENVSRFRDAYRAVLDELAPRGIVPVLVTIQEEKRDDRAAGRNAANGVIRELAAEYGAVLVESDIDYDEDRDLFAEDDEEGVHLDDDGHRYLSDLTRAALLAYFTHGAFAP